MLTLPSVLTQREACEVFRNFREALANTERDSTLVVNSAALEHFDSSALAVLLACQRHAISTKQSLVVQGMPPKLVELATLYGVEALLPTEPASAQ